MAGNKSNYSTIADVSIKYIKDEDGNIVSPIVSGESVFLPNEDLMLQDKIDSIDTKLNTITTDADSVSFTQSLTSGTKVGTITINGAGTDLYAPASSTGISFSSLVPTKHTILSPTNANPGNTKSSTVTVTKSGYYPIGICGWDGSGSEIKYYISSASLGTAKVYYTATNPHPNTVTFYLNVWIMWAK